MDENQTRRELIDKALNKAKWDINDKSLVTLEYQMEKLWDKNKIASPKEEYVTNNEFADYVLYGRDHSPIAIVEAKRTSKDPRIGQKQAEGYADNLKEKFGLDPFIFLSNGYDIWFWDRERYPKRKIQGFFTKTDLERLTYQRKEALPLPQVNINADIAGRDYQVEAIQTVCEGIENGFRKFLLVMATGTGKTRTTIALIDKLLRAKRINTVLFLTDRVLLRDQAYGKKGFQGFFNESCGKIKSGDFDKTKRLYTATIQTMMECYKDISTGFFDLVISDECHRSIYNKWKDVLIYFDAIQVGLTATPAEYTDRDTFSFFEVDLDNLPQKNFFNYSYDQAVREKHLLLFNPYHAKTSVQREGVKDDQIPDEVKQRLIEEGKTLDDLNFEGTDFEKKFTNTETHNAMVKEFMDVCYKDNTGTLPGKTIIFAMTKAHAYRIQEAFDRLYPQYKGKLTEVIVSDDSRSDTFLTRFEQNSFPRVAISVDMLDTGIDIREVVNLVFAKPIFTKIRFWQMIGRGTRTLDKNDIKEWCTEKKDFLIVDFWNNFEYFDIKPQGEAPPAQEALPTKVFRAKVYLLRLYKKQNNINELEKTKYELQEMISSLPKESISIKESRHIIERVENKDFWKYLDFDYLIQFVAPLMRYMENINLDEYSFKLKCTNLKIALLENNIERKDKIKRAIKEDLNCLTPSLSITAVKKVQSEIFKASSEDFWETLTLDSVNEIEEKIIPIIKYKRKDPVELPDTHVPDIIAERKWIKFGPNNEGEYVSIYREKVENKIKALVENNEIIKKIKTNKKVTDKELRELEKLFYDREIFSSDNDLSKAYKMPKGVFVNLIKDIAHEALKEEQIKLRFDNFLKENNFNSDQSRFLRIVKNVFLDKIKRNETLSELDLYVGLVESEGFNAVERLFEKSQVGKILEFFKNLGKAA